MNSQLSRMKEEQSLNKKQEIIDKAIEFFSKNGVADKKIADITNAVGIGKGTFYLHFNGKKDLLLNCIDRLATIIVPKEVWLDIREETNYKLRFQKRLIAFRRAYPTFCGILTLVNQIRKSLRRCPPSERYITGELNLITSISNTFESVLARGILVDAIAKDKQLIWPGGDGSRFLH